MATFVRPDATVAAGGWLTSAAGSDLHTAVDEVNADDGDYIVSGANPANDTCRISLGDIGGTATGLTVRYRIWKQENSGTSQQDMRVRLLEGETVRATWTHTDIGTTPTTITQTVDSAVCATISDFSNLTLEFTANPPAGVNAENVATLRNVSGGTITDYPLYIGRVFAEGEIANAPEILVDGVAQGTGADVKTRWPDTTVKHAILSTVIASAANNTDIALTFQNQADDDTALSKADMLNARFDFDCVLSVTVGGVTDTASARDMLTADHYTVHCASQVATTIILADHSASATYDMTWSSVKLRPVIYATFWNDLDKVDIRVDAEQSNAEAIGDLSVSTLSISIGNTSPSTVYTQTSFTLLAGSIFSKRGLWLGGAPESNVDLNYNLAYLASVKAVANYDTSITLNGNYLTDLLNSWNALSAANKLMYGTGLYNQYMPAGGTRPELGPMPSWSLLWLYSGKWQARDLALNHADLAGAWAMNFRETVATKKMRKSHAADSGTGFSFPITCPGRPTTALGGVDVTYNYSYTAESDRIKLVGSDSTVWTWDIQHQPDAFSTQYALTGDPHYLKMMQFWASASAHWSNGAAIDQTYGRGPTGQEGGFGEFVEVRGYGWGSRSRGLAAYYTPDNDPYKPYLEDLIDDALAHLEGKYGITTGTYNGNALWQWAFDWEDPGRPNALHFMTYNQGQLWGQSNWMVNFALFGVARLVELGYTNAATLRDWIGAWHNDFMTNHPNPFMMGDYQSTTSAAGVTFYQNWTDVYNSPNTPAANKTKNDFEDVGDQGIGVFSNGSIDHHYAHIAAGAQTFVTHLTNGATVKSFYDTHVRALAAVISAEAYNPKWAIRQRT